MNYKLGHVAAGGGIPDRNDPPLRVVANNGWSGWNANNPGVAGTSRSRHVAGAACSDLRLVYVGWYAANPGPPGVDTDQPSALPIKASIEIGGTIRRVTFSGQIQGNVDPGGTLVSDPVGADLTAGEVFWVRTYTSSTSWFGNTASWTTTGNIGGRANGDLTAPGSGAVAASISYLYAPSAILGRPASRTAPSVVIVGDSISTGETTDRPSSAWSDSAAPAGGYIARALTVGSVPWLAIGCTGERASNFAGANSYRRRALVPYASQAIVNYAINDILDGQTLTQIQGNLITVWGMLQARGCKVWQTTITPHTTSSDSWATVGNQTVADGTQNAVRISLNTWIRDGAPILSGVAAPSGSAAAGTLRAGSAGHPLAGYFDAADYAESARNSGLWIAGGSVDGLHPSVSGHAAIAACISVAALIQAA